MKTLVIANGLSKNFLGVEAPFSNSKQNLGQAEIQRLFGGSGKMKEGPLGHFLQSVAKKTKQSKDIALIVLKDSKFCKKFNNAGQHFSKQFDDVVRQSNVIEVPLSDLPIFKIDNFVSENWVTGEIKNNLNIILVGGHTENRILSLAQTLKNAFGYKNIAVCSHLVGSPNPDGHFGSLKHQYQLSGITVFQTLEEAWNFSNLETENLDQYEKEPCQIEPLEVKKSLGEYPTKIIELLCMNLTKVSLRPLQGGFSGSYLFLADGQKGKAHTEPLVIKIDNYIQMRRELDGYYRVKDFLGKNVPSFDFPVTLGDQIGVAMELASMDGSPETLQDTFEKIDNDAKLNRFLIRLEKSLNLVSEKLYQNTVNRIWIVPYRLFWLHTQEQANWLEENGTIALSYLSNEGAKKQKIDIKKLKKVFRLISGNENGVVGPECLVHGDLNLANIICDKGDNIWFIDWTHCSNLPGALDFAKMESDVKLVISKDFDLIDLPNLKLFEEYLLTHAELDEIELLPNSLKFVKWDLRYRKIYYSIKHIRECYFKLTGDNNWLIYRIGLLRYSLHTLSFDKKRDRGECEPVQLIYALYSSQSLIFDLAGDDFNLVTRGEKAPHYPDRYRVFIDEAPWVTDCEHYNPPYYVDEEVLKNNYKEVSGGWAEPESVDGLEHLKEYPKLDTKGRPLNPRGRTGIEGRGALGLWGANQAVGLVVTRANKKDDCIEILIGKHSDGSSTEIPKGFLLPEENCENAFNRVLHQETSISGIFAAPKEVQSGYLYDPRQTDHAWVEINSYWAHLSDRESEKWDNLTANTTFDALKWVPLNPNSINLLPSYQASLVRNAIKLLNKDQLLSDELVRNILDATG